jgi:hypothetical protein
MGWRIGQVLIFERRHVCCACQINIHILCSLALQRCQVVAHLSREQRFKRNPLVADPQMPSRVCSLGRWPCAQY